MHTNTQLYAHMLGARIAVIWVLTKRNQEERKFCCDMGFDKKKSRGKEVLLWYGFWQKEIKRKGSFAVIWVLTKRNREERMFCCDMGFDRRKLRAKDVLLWYGFWQKEIESKERFAVIWGEGVRDGDWRWVGGCVHELLTKMLMCAWLMDHRNVFTNWTTFFPTTHTHSCDKAVPLRESTYFNMEVK